MSKTLMQFLVMVANSWDSPPSDLRGCLLPVRIWFTVVIVASSSLAANELPKQLQGVGIDQRLGSQVPLDVRLFDEAGIPTTLKSYIDKRPSILVLAYFRCPMLCTEVLNGMVESLRRLPSEFDGTYNVIVVSFDPRDTPALATAKKAVYLCALGNQHTGRHWHFLTGDAKSTRAVADAVGFHYQYDPASEQFAHASGIMTLTPAGCVSRYFFGIHFNPNELRLGLVDASHEDVGSPIDQILLYCFHYDSADGKYTPTVMAFIRFGGGLTILSLVVLVGLNLWRDRAKSKLLLPKEAD
jgi:protein SCO1/2